MDTNELMTGTVVKVILNKGFAFIRGSDGLTRFAHVRDFTEQKFFDLLHEGQEVEFTPMDLNRTDKFIRGNGLRAIRIRVVS